MRVLVCGGRDYRDYDKISSTLKDLCSKDNKNTIIQGGARGADQSAKEFAGDFGIEYLTFHADWDKHGKAAGYIRNKQMLGEGKPDLVVAFPGGRGTANMVELAQAAGVETKIISD